MRESSAPPTHSIPQARRPRSAIRMASPLPSTAPSPRPRNSSADTTCKDLDEAIYWAGKIPTECKGGSGSIEIRPIMEIPELEKMIKEAATQAV